MAATKRNIYKFLGISTIPEEVFSAALSEAGKQVRLQSKVDAVETDNGTRISCGPLAFYVSKDKTQTYVVNKDRPIGTAYPLFVKPKHYETMFNKWCTNIFIKILKEKNGEDAQGNYRDMQKIVKIGAILARLCPPKGKKFNDMMRILMHHVWNALDKEALSIGIKASGSGITSFDYNFLATNIVEAKKVYATTPAVIQLWLAEKHNKYKMNTEMILPIDRHLFVSVTEEQQIKAEEYRRKQEAEAAKALADSVQTAEVTDTFTNILCVMNKPSPTNIIYKSENIVAEAQHFLKSEGCDGKKAWKFVCKMPPRWVHRVLANARGDNRGRAFKYLAEIGELPRFTLLKPFAALGYDLQPTPRCAEEVKIAFFRKMFRQSKKRPAKTFWTKEASLTWDWVLRGEHVFDKNQLNASWDWFMRMQQDWHQEAEARRREENARWQARYKDQDTRQFKWDSLLEEFEIDGYKVVPMITSELLRAEGKDMHHCVGSYDYDCEQGNSRIFSIRQIQGEEIVETHAIAAVGDPTPVEIVTMKEAKKPERATLEIRRYAKNISDDGQKHYSWTINQTRSYCNADANEAIKRIANLVLNKYNALTRQAEDAEIAKQKEETKPMALVGTEAETKVSELQVA